MAFDSNVFINCPFDKRYKVLLEPLLFCCLYCGLEPQIARTVDSGASRIEQILGLIKSSKFSIHDLSRMQATRVGQLSRFNMPFELGLDLGIRFHGSGALSQKKCLVLDEEKHRYQAALSDLSGSDIQAYGNERKYQVNNIIRLVRNWFVEVLDEILPAPNVIFLDYTEFVSDLERILLGLGFSNYDLKNLTTTEFIHYAREWIEKRQRD